jgi:hypothetical protein
MFKIGVHIKIRQSSRFFVVRVRCLMGLYVGGVIFQRGEAGVSLLKCISGKRQIRQIIFSH